MSVGPEKRHRGADEGKGENSVNRESLLSFRDSSTIKGKAHNQNKKSLQGVPTDKRRQRTLSLPKKAAR